MKKIIWFDKSVVIISTILIMIFSKLLKIYYLNENFFHDSNLILDLMKGIGISNDSNYNYSFAANVFSSTNFLHLSSVIQFDIFFGIVFSILLLLFEVFCLKKNVSLLEFVIISFLTLFLNVYTFSLSKDLIQFVLIIAFIVLIFLFKNKRIGLLVSCIPLIIVSVFLRNYFYAVVVFYVFIYLALGKSKSKGFFVLFSICSIMMLLLLVYIIKFYDETIYNKIMVSNEVYSNTEANTKFNNIFDNSNFFFFCINYIINFTRFLFPIELLTKGIYYWFFLIYHFLILYILGKSFKKVFIDKRFRMTYSLVASFFMVCVLFEPDFGSFLRHQISISALYLFFIFSFDRSYGYDDVQLCSCYN